jgi:hypothetical protein
MFVERVHDARRVVSVHAVRSVRSIRSARSSIDSIRRPLSERTRSFESDVVRQRAVASGRDVECAGSAFSRIASSRRRGR